MDVSWFLRPQNDIPRKRERGNMDLEGKKTSRSVLVCSGCREKYYRLGILKEVYFLTVLQGRAQDQGPTCIAQGTVTSLLE